MPPAPPHAAFCRDTLQSARGAPGVGVGTSWSRRRAARGQLRAESLVDRYYWIQSPVWLGDTGVPATLGWTVAALSNAERWCVVERRALAEDTLLVLDREPCSPAW